MPKGGLGLGLGRHGFVIAIGAASQYRVTASTYSPVSGTNVTITAQLTDASGNPVATAGKIVTWSKSDPGGSFGSPTSTTNASGVATVTFTTSATNGIACTVTATDNSTPTALTGTSATITTSAGGIVPDAVIQALINGELDAGMLTFYTGSPPASTADAPSGVTALADVTFASPSAPSANLVSNTDITLNVGTGFVNVSGTATWGRAKSVDGLHVYDFLLATSAGPNTMVANAVVWTAGQTLTITLMHAVG